MGPSPVCTGSGNLTPSGFDPRTVQPLASRYIDCGIPTHQIENTGCIFKSYLSHFLSACNGRVGSEVLATRYRLEGLASNPGVGEVFRTCPDRHWGLPSVLYNGYWVFPGGKAAGACCWTPTRSQERVGHYVCSPSGTQWPVIGRTLLVCCFSCLHSYFTVIAMRKGIVRFMF